MSNLVERESDLSSKSTVNLVHSKVTVKSQSSDDSSQGKEQAELENAEKRFLYFLANLANDGLVYVDCPSKLSPLEAPGDSENSRGEKKDSLDGYNNFDGQDKPDKSNVLHKDIDGCGCSRDTDDDDFKFILGNEYDTDDDDGLCT